LVARQRSEWISSATSRGSERLAFNVARHELQMLSASELRVNLLERELEPTMIVIRLTPKSHQMSGPECCVCGFDPWDGHTLYLTLYGSTVTVITDQRAGERPGGIGQANAERADWFFAMHSRRSLCRPSGWRVGVDT